MPPGAPGADPSLRIRRQLTILDSCTARELDGLDVIDQSRLLRIARGSGVHPDEVGHLLMSHKQMEQTVVGLNKSGLLKGGDAAFQSKMMRNPGQMMQQLQKSMNPNMLRQMGGAGGIMDMMKSLGGGMGGGPGGPGGLDLKAMMKQFGGR